jgi:molybdopterin converting factor small subunit
MEVTVQYTGQLAGFAGISEERVAIGDDAVLGDLVEHLCERHGTAYADLVVNSEGRIRPSTLVILDGEQAVGDSSQLPLENGQTVLLMTPIAGG